MSHFHNTALIGASGSGAGGDAYKIDRSLRFNSGDSAYLNRTPSSAGNRKTWTWSGWIKRSDLTSGSPNGTVIFSADTGNAPWTAFQFESSDATLQITTFAGSSPGLKTNAQFRDPSAWYHLVIAFDTTQSTASDRVKCYVNGVAQTFSNTNYPAQNSDTKVNGTFPQYIGFTNNQYFDGYLADVYLIDGQALAPTDFGEYDSNNVWQPKAYAGTYGTNGWRLDFSDNSSDQALGYDATATTPTLNPRGGFDVITYTGNGSGQSLTGLGFSPSLVWVKSRNAGYSHNFYDTVRGVDKALFSDTTDAETTYDGRLTSFDPDGFTVGDTSTAGVGTNGNNTNYVAWCWKAGGPAVLNENGSIDSQVSVSTDYGFSIVSYTGDGSGTDTIGHGLNTAPSLVITKSRGTTGSWRVFTDVGGTWKLGNLNNTDTFVNATVSAPTSSVFSIDGNSNASTTHIAYCWSEVSGFSKFGSYTGTGSAGVSVTTGFKPRWVMIKETGNSNPWFIYDNQRGTTNILWANEHYSESTIGAGDGSNQNAIEVNSTGFTIPHTLSGTNRSGGNFIYAAFADRPGNNWTPNNLIAEAGLETASQGMDVVTYTGTGSTQSISSLEFQPDLVWLKRRDSAGNHNIQDVVRGASAVLQSDYNGGQFTSGPRISSFDTNGFTLTSDNGANTSGGTYVAWCWKAGGTASSNTDGQITSTVSVNQTYGFSVVKFTAGGSYGMRSIGHGLGVKPSLVISKRTDGSGDWLVHTDVTGSILQLDLNNTDAAAAASSYYSANTSTFSLYHGHYMDNGYEFINYCWSEVPGFSRFGSYTSSSNTAQTITTGFKPRFVIIRGTGSGGFEWVMYDSARGSSNHLRANSSAAENDPSGIGDLTFGDDSFSIPASGDNGNIRGGGTYIYMAFADKPPGEIIDSLIDTPTNYEASSGNNGGNYATLNPLNKHTSNNSLTNGNLDFTTSGNDGCLLESTIAMSSGKFYFEVVYSASGTGQLAGIRKPGARNYNDSYIYVGTGNKYTDGGSSASYGATLAHGDVIGTAFDATNGTLTFYKNGVSQGTAFTGISGTYSFFVGSFGTAPTGIVNFGQRPFAYTPPTGFKSLCTTNLTDPTIADGSTAMDVALWTGTGATRSITGLGFSPDFVWIKKRSGTTAHNLFDIVRGANKPLFSNLTNAELSDGRLTAFNSDGFTLDSDNAVNDNNQTHVGWAWDAGTSTATNNNGSIQSTVRANQSAGFSIVIYTGTGSNATVGHGLNAAPEMVLYKSRGDGNDWMVYHIGMGAAKSMLLNSNSAEASRGDTFNNNAPTNSVLHIGTSATTSNTNSAGMIAYCFTPVAGYSAFGSYTGNGSSDGPFVFTGFRPALVIAKRSSAQGDWIIHDTTRTLANGTGDNNTLVANVANAEDGYYTATQVSVDYLSNGFKLRHGGGPLNDSGSTYIFAAWAEHPFKTARAR